MANAQCEDTSNEPQTATWDDSPWVTAVGGTVPNVSRTDGSKLGPDPIWHVSGIFSEGAGLSAVYPRPAYQDGVAPGFHAGNPSEPQCGSRAGLRRSWGGRVSSDRR